MEAGAAQTATPRFPRRDLRQATLIVPTTGERLKRKFTLRDPKIFSQRTSSANADERAPLIPKKDDKPVGRVQRTLQWLWKAPHAVFSWIVKFVISREGQGVLKCSLAYFLATMFVFVTALTFLLGTGDSKHLVANFVVWFHPARSAGSMDHGTVLATVAFIYAAFVCYTSMGISTFFISQGLQNVGYAVMLIVCCGGGLGFIAWVKQRSNDVLVNVSCSLAALPIGTVLTKDPATRDGHFSHNNISQVLRMMIIAITLSTAISLLIRPIYARSDLYGNFIETTDALADLLASITSGFLAGQEDDLKHPRAIEAADKVASVFSSLDQTLSEARDEHYLLGTEKQYHIEQRLVQCIQRLAQDVGGLRSAASIQFSLLQESTSTKHDGAQGDVQSRADLKPSAVPSNADDSEFPGATAGHEASEASSNDSTAPLPTEEIVQSPGASEPRRLVTSAEVFSAFIEHLGPPMKSLAYTLNQILKELPFGPAPKYPSTLHPNFATSLKDALQLFATSRKEALDLVYRGKEASKAGSVEIAADFEEVAASCGHFSSSLQDLGDNCLTYLDTLEELNQCKERKGRSWQWLLFWRSPKPSTEHQTVRAESVNSAEHQDTDFPLDIPSLGTRRYHSSAMQQEMRLTQKSIRYRLWKLLRPLRRDDIRFAIKVGLGAIALVSLAYIPQTQAFFYRWRMEWALATYVFVVAMTVGAANSTVVARLEGTATGAILSVIVWIIAQENAYALAFIGWIVSLGCFYLNLILNQGPMSRFILLTYNLSILYSYSLTVQDYEGGKDDDEGGAHPEIWEIAWHRFIAVSIGICWGLVITQAVWPISARRKLKAGLSLLWLRMALIWKRAPLSVLLETDSSTPTYMHIAEELRLRQLAILLDTLRQNAEAEFMLRGPFPTESYNTLLKCTGRMLDSFHSLSVIITKDSKASPGESEILRFTSDEREQLAKRISHLFSVLASSVKLEFPLNDTLPSVEHTRDRLLAKVFHFRQESDKHPAVVDEDFELLYAYALVTAQLAKEIETASKELEKLYGVLSEEMLQLQ